MHKVNKKGCDLPRLATPTPSLLQNIDLAMSPPALLAERLHLGNIHPKDILKMHLEHGYFDSDFVT